MNCIISAWGSHEAELRGFLTHRLNSPIMAEDILQETFMRAMEQGTKFCDVENPRAWLFRVARNLLVDSHRLDIKHKQSSTCSLTTESGEDLDFSEEYHPPISALESLDVCLPRALLELSSEDQQAIKTCDLEGTSQADYANSTGLSLTAAKSRIQRARQRLKQSLTQLCQVNFDQSGKICCIDPNGNSNCKV